MSPASCGGRAVNTLRFLSTFAVSAIALAAMAFDSPAAARGGGGSHAAPTAAPRAAPLVTVAPRPAPIAQQPAFQRPPAGQAHQGGRIHALGHPVRPRVWMPSGSSFLPSPAGPATFRPSATWRQQHFRHFSGAPSATAVAIAEPQIIYAPDAAVEPPLEYTHGEPPLDYGQVAPCTAPLIIHIGGGAQQSSASGVRVVHAQNSGCGAPQVVNYTGPRVLQVEPSARPQARHPHRHGKRVSKGFKVVRAR